MTRTIPNSELFATTASDHLNQARQWIEEASRADSVMREDLEDLADDIGSILVKLEKLYPELYPELVP